MLSKPGQGVCICVCAHNQVRFAFLHIKGLRLFCIKHIGYADVDAWMYISVGLAKLASSVCKYKRSVLRACSIQGCIAQAAITVSFLLKKQNLPATAVVPSRALALAGAAVGIVLATIAVIVC